MSEEIIQDDIIRFIRGEKFDITNEEAIEWIKKNCMTSGQILDWMTEYACKYVKENAYMSIARNRHMNGYNGFSYEEVFNLIEHQDILVDAAIVDFINYIGMKRHVDYGLYVRDLYNENKNLKNINENNIKNDKLYTQSDILANRIDWDNIMKMPRYAGGHDDQMRGLLKNVTLLGHYNEGDYQGQVATCVLLNDTGEVVIYNDYYGSCSGCDAWEDASDDDVRQMCRQIACGAYIFKNFCSCYNFLTGDIDMADSWKELSCHLLASIIGNYNGRKMIKLL